MKKIKPYKYRIRIVAPPETSYGQTLVRTGNQEVLSGVINGMKASDLEERVSKSLTKLEVPFDFRVRISSDALGDRHLTNQFANIRGEIEIDMLCDVGGLITPVMVDGGISHFYTAWQADEDKIKTNAVDEFGRKFGWNPTVRIPFWNLIDQTMTDRTVRDALRL